MANSNDFVIDETQYNAILIRVIQGVITTPMTIFVFIGKSRNAGKVGICTKSANCQ